jgi:hypothetical protein
MPTPSFLQAPNLPGHLTGHLTGHLPGDLPGYWAGTGVRLMLSRLKRHPRPWASGGPPAPATVLTGGNPRAGRLVE